MTAHPLASVLASLHDTWKSDCSGAVAGYIPELAKAGAEDFALAVATCDGAVYSAGDASQMFTIQSMSKPFAYAAALDRFGPDGVMRYVGVEPTGDAFNSIVLDEVNHRPFNPMVNAGAIAVAALYEGGGAGQKTERMMGTLSAFAGRPLDIDGAVHRSEAETGHRNRAIAYLMLNGGMLASDAETALDVYFRQCSVRVNTVDLALMAATLANAGRHPVSGARAVQSAHVPAVLSVMLSCGMYDYAGQWAYEVGLPAKSGVSGGVLLVVPGQFGVAAYSPRLDRFGNSVRAVQSCRDFVRRLHLHSMAAPPMHGAASLGIREGLKSTRWRSPAQEKLLEGGGAAPVQIEINSALTAAMAELAVRTIEDKLAAGKSVVLDLRRIEAVGPGAGLLLEGWLGQRLPDRYAFRVIARKGGPTAAWLDGHAAEHHSAGLDAAVQDIEDAWLARTGAAGGEGTAELSAVPFLAGLAPAARAELLAAVQPDITTFAAGETIVRAGDAPDWLFVVRSGSVSVYAGLRINAMGPGAHFGEMALIDRQPRSADVAADVASSCWRLSIGRLEDYLGQHPEAKSAVVAALLKDMTGRLRRATELVASMYGES